MGGLNVIDVSGAMGKQKTILLGRRCGKLNFEGALRVFLTRVGGPKAMTDEKKLPWNNALSILRPALLNTPERVIKYLHGFVLVPEPEALRLHALDLEVVKLHERVRKFEEIARSILRNPGSSSLDSAKRLLREAMGEDR